MPSSRTERILFGAGVAVIVLLSALLLPAWKSYHDGAKRSAPAVTARVPEAGPAARMGLVPGDPGGGVARSVALARGGSGSPPPADLVGKAPKARQRVSQAPTVSRTQPARNSPDPPSTLRLVARRGDCWLSIRRDTSAGAEIYSGTLVKGRSLSFPLGTLWIRFGAPQNVDAVVSGRKRAIPTSSFNVVVRRSGFNAAPE